MTKTVISKELEKKLTQEYGRLSFRDKLMLVYAVSETTQELKAQIEKMKMCCNCAKWRSWKEELDDVSYPCVRHDCDSKCSLWKLKE